jgi:ubiquinone/menaquinone biosynthesis C-methylase UbiE
MKAVYFQAPTTNRSVTFLAYAHHFLIARRLIERIPHGGSVIDVGAGDSPLGEYIAQHRSDVTVVKFDFSYLESMPHSTMPNLSYVGGDATMLETYFAPATFDCVFSYWLFPHLSLYSSKPAEMAARAVLAVAKPGAMISIGPCRFSPQTLRCTKSTLASENERIVAKIAYLTKLRGIPRLTTLAHDEVITPYFNGNTHHFDLAHVVPRIYSLRTQRFVSVLRPEGLSIIASLLWLTYKYFRRRNSATQ